MRKSGLIPRNREFTQDFWWKEHYGKKYYQFNACWSDGMRDVLFGSFIPEIKEFALFTCDIGAAYSRVLGYSYYDPETRSHYGSGKYRYTDAVKALRYGLLD